MRGSARLFDQVDGSLRIAEASTTVFVDGGGGGGANGAPAPSGPQAMIDQSLTNMAPGVDEGDYFATITDGEDGGDLSSRSAREQYYKQNGIVQDDPTVTGSASYKLKNGAVGKERTSDIAGKTHFPGDFQLSPNFKLRDLTTGCRVARYNLRPQKGLSQAQIVQNLRNLCDVVLEPLVQKYGRSAVIINSAFRHGGGGSQHNVGQAVDVAFASTDRNKEAAFKRAQEIVNTLPNFDQFLFERGVSTMWFHISWRNPPRPAGSNKVMTSPNNGKRFIPGIAKF